MDKDAMYDMSTDSMNYHLGMCTGELFGFLNVNGSTQLDIQLENRMGEEGVTMTLRKVLYIYIKLFNGNILFTEVHQ